MPIQVMASRWLGAELLDELADERLGGVGGEAAGVVGGVHDVEQELGEALAVFGGGGRLRVAWEFLWRLRSRRG